jgi:hypothetical protein
MLGLTKWPRRRRFAAQLANCRQHLASMAEENAHILEVLVSQMRKHRDIDAVLSEAFAVLGHAEFFEPISNLLHRRPPTLRLSVLDPQDRKSTTHANKL